VQYPGGDAGEPAQGARIVEIAHQRAYSGSAQGVHPPHRRSERHQLQAPAQVARHALAHVAATDDQQAFSPEPRWQRAGGAID
jgi:hypothetical protein